jgi:hypothetical protein
MVLIFLCTLYFKSYVIIFYDEWWRRKLIKYLILVSWTQSGGCTYKYFEQPTEVKLPEWQTKRYASFMRSFHPLQTKNLQSSYTKLFRHCLFPQWELDGSHTYLNCWVKDWCQPDVSVSQFRETQREGLKFLAIIHPKSDIHRNKAMYSYLQMLVKKV